MRRLGMIQILLSGACFGFLGLFGKSAYERGMTPGELLSFRFLFAAVILGALFMLTAPKRLLIGRPMVAKSLALGAFGYAVFSSCYFEALKGLSASLTVLLLYLYPLMVAVASWVFFGEKIAPRKWIALPLLLVGLVCLIWGEINILNPVALLFGFGSAVFYSGYILVSSRWLRGVDVLASVVYIQAGAGLALAFTHWRDLNHITLMASQNWLLVTGIAVICTVLAMSLFLAGLTKLKNWEASVLSTGEPVMGILLAVAFLGEAFTLTQVVGAFSVLAAFIIVALP